MKKNYYNFSELIKDRIVLVMTGAVMLTGNLAAQTSYSFTSAGLSGSLAPTQGQITTAYASTNLNNSVTVTGNGIQQFTLPFGGNYEITCYGPQGGNSSDNNNGGLGAKIQGEFNFAAGTVLDIVVGQRGASSTSNASGGGAGGSGVRQGSTLLIVAGGGGGAGRGNVNVMGASNTNNGTASTTGAIMGGTGGNGGNAIGNNGGGCGGGGYLTQGAKPPGGTPNQAGPGGFAATGGARSIWCGGTSGAGGFGVGGGGGAEDQYGGAGGGGGYSGGAGGEWGNSGWCGTPAAAGGGGGGSYNTGANPVNTGSFVSGDGMVVIKFMCSAPLSGATSICSGQSTTLTINASGNILWSTGSTQPSVVLSPAVTTQYSVTGTGTPNGCTSTQIFSVIVNPLPVITTTVTPALLCVGSQATLAASGASTYVWSTGPTGTTTTASPIVTTNYSVTGTSSAGCVSTFVFPLNVNALQLSISGNTVICNGKQTTLTGGGGTSLAWAGYGPFGSISPSPTITTGYTLTGIDPNNCLNTLTTSILVNPTPTVQVAASKTLACKGEAVTFTVSGTGVTSYTWSPSAGSSNNAVISISHPINTVYSYSAAGSDNNGCVGGSNSIAVKVELCTGINELNGGAERISVYPNPSNGNFSIRAEAGAQLTIVNQLGQSVANYTTANDKEIQLKDLAKGIYFITFEKGEVKQTKKVIVE